MLSKYNNENFKVYFILWVSLLLCTHIASVTKVMALFISIMGYDYFAHKAYWWFPETRSYAIVPYEFDINFYGYIAHTTHKSMYARFQFALVWLPIGWNVAWCSFDIVRIALQHLTASHNFHILMLVMIRPLIGWWICIVRDININILVHIIRVLKY